MRNQILAIEQLLRQKLNDVFLETLKHDWSFEKSRHQLQDGLYVREKEYLDRMVNEHDEARGKLMEENFENIVKLRKKLNTGALDAKLLQVIVVPSNDNNQKKENDEKTTKNNDNISSP